MFTGSLKGRGAGSFSRFIWEINSEGFAQNQAAAFICIGGVLAPDSSMELCKSANATNTPTSLVLIVICRSHSLKASPPVVERVLKKHTQVKVALPSRK